MRAFEFTVPVLVAGGGACGTTAALAARHAGAEVLLVEQDDFPQGTTAMSQGLICAAGTKAQAEAGVEDDADIFFQDILTKTKGQTDHRLARAIADQAGPTVDWMVDQMDMPYGLDIRFKPSYGHTRPRIHGWLGHGGSDLVQLLHARAEAKGVDILTGARLTRILADADGRVEGVEITRPGGDIEQIGCAALVLGMGGFAGNRQMVARYMPEATAAAYNGHEGSHGDAVSLGLSLGAAVGDMGSYQGYGMLTDPQGLSVPPSVVVEGGFLVNTAGLRFVDETADIAGMVHPVLAQPDGQAWVIFDAEIEARCAYIPETAQLIALNAAKIAGTIPDLAQAINVPIDALEASFAEARQARAEGRKDALGRDWSGDPPPSGAYRALKVRGAIYHTQGGLQTDGAARVLRPDGSALPNLYAGGGSARGVSGPSFWGYLPAMGLCAAVTLGRLAGLNAAKSV
jgi:fumarate reductase flavoprotein subunit